MEGTQFTIRRKVFTLLATKFHVYSADGRLLGFCKQKAFKLKEDIRFYTDETMADERLVITARAVIDFSAVYDIIDGQTKQKIGVLQRKGLKSMFRDEWAVLDENEYPIGMIREDDAWLALIRRTIFKFLPQKYHMFDQTGRMLAEYQTHFNPFIHRMTVTVGRDCPCNPLLTIAAGILLMAIEGRQN
jgi:hypothetical protein